MIVRVRGAEGTRRVEVGAGWTVGDLRAAIGASVGLAPERTEMLLGFPPAPLERRGDTLPATDAVRNGDIITVQACDPQKLESGLAASAQAATASEHDVYKAAPQARAATYAATANSAGRETVDSTSIAAQGVMQRVRVPDDNSCLFRSVHNVLHEQQRLSLSAERLRAMVADHIRLRPEEFSEVTLGRAPEEYCAWIQQPNSWGGAIELSILSRELALELTAVDTQTLRLDRYGEDQNYAQRALLIYDGLHYDSLSLSIADGALQLTQFPIDDVGVLASARNLAATFRATGEFTDTARFTLRCADCNTRLTGEKEAVAHAKATGHANFRENT